MHLTIQLLGAPQFQLDNLPMTASRRAVIALLAYLTVTHAEHPNQMHSRDSLAALLWTNYSPTKALSNLRHTLWEVAQFIGGDWILTEHEFIHWNQQADSTLDIALFRSSLNRALQEDIPGRRIPFLEDAVKLYRGDFLEGFILKDGDNFNEWAQSQAERLRSDFVDALEILVDDHSALDQAASAISYTQRLITIDPLRENAHRKLMQLYAITDQSPAAIKQYQSLEKLLRKELNIDPQLETRKLYKKIRKGELSLAAVKKNIQNLDSLPPKHNLPVQLTTFIGRERERDQVTRLISQNRLVTLIGAGGIGKTRLAVQTGHHLLSNYADGVWFISLEALTDEEVVPQTILSFLNIAELPHERPVDTLSKNLGRKTLVLILDNCEHLLDACAQVVDVLLKNCPNVRILITTRESLRLEGEALYQVPALAIPTRYENQSIDELARYEAVRLFVERARLLISNFELTNSSMEMVIRVCNLLGGIPLAIELAAAHVDVFALEEILDQLNHSFDLLVSYTRSVLPRHQTMRASIDWGWNLLTQEERVLMRRLSVFIGGWTLEAAKALGVDRPREIISGLVRKSFVVPRQPTEHEIRYGFHEVIRVYAQERLKEAGEEESLRDRHLEYFLELARQLEPALQGVDQQQWLERLFVERDNIRAALEWAARTNVLAGLYLSNKLRNFWERYDLREEVRWLLMI